MEQHRDTRAAGSTHLHHLGFVVASIASSAPGFIRSMDLQWDEEVFHDPVQTVRVTFLRHRNTEMPAIELVEPASPQSRVNSFLRKGGGLHHICYEVGSLDQSLEQVLSTGAILLQAAVPAVAFKGREIAWVCTRERLLIEYLQSEPSSAAGIER